MLLQATQRKKEGRRLIFSADSASSCVGDIIQKANEFCRKFWHEWIWPT